MKEFLVRLSEGPRVVLVGLVKLYRLFFRGWIGSRCRFEPSCSEYSLQALTKHGAIVGCYLTANRFFRCQPYCAGGHDPVPEKTLFTGLTDRLRQRQASHEKTL